MVLDTRDALGQTQLVEFIVPTSQYFSRTRSGGRFRHCHSAPRRWLPLWALPPADRSNKGYSPQTMCPFHYLHFILLMIHSVVTVR
uniref:Uncharacterized protein n=1 Tax=Anguilla anguilla TaxID=7936 RepID=A0A0E9SFH8_ANGAN